MAFQRISDDESDGEEKDIVGAGSIAEPDLTTEKKFGGADDDSLESDADSLEDKIDAELDDDEEEGNEM